MYNMYIVMFSIIKNVRDFKKLSSPKVSKVLNLDLMSSWSLCFSMIKDLQGFEKLNSSKVSKVFQIIKLFRSSRYSSFSSQ